jgi:hypothetical protein
LAVVSIQRKCTSKYPSSELPSFLVDGDGEYKYVLFIILVFFQTTRPYFGVTTIMTMTFDKVKKKSTALT